jgi:hypothetical protein
MQQFVARARDTPGCSDRRLRRSARRRLPPAGRGAAQQPGRAVDGLRAHRRGDADWAPLLAGQGLRLARAEASAAEIVESIVEGVLTARERWVRA